MNSRKKEATVGLPFEDVSSFYPFNLFSNSYDLKLFLCLDSSSRREGLSFSVCRATFYIGSKYPNLSKFLKHRNAIIVIDWDRGTLIIFFWSPVKHPGIIDPFGCLLLCLLPGRFGRKEEWQLEDCQEQIANEYDKLYGRKGTQPLLAAPGRWMVGSGMICQLILSFLSS